MRAFALDAAGERREPIEPSRVLGARMSRVIGEAGGSRWSLDQLEGLKSPATLVPSVSSSAAADVRIDINDWPAIEGAPRPQLRALVAAGFPKRVYDEPATTTTEEA